MKPFASSGDYRQSTAAPQRASRRDVYLALCRCLAPCLGYAPPPRPKMAWERLIEAADQHSVLPALSWSLHRRADASDVRPYLDGMLRINQAHNRALRTALTAVLRTLEPEDIRVALLKGAASLFSDVYPDPAICVAGDLDLLVAPDRIEKARRALLASGFVAGDGRRARSAGVHHAVSLRHRKTGVYVELHRHLLGQLNRNLLPTEAVWGHAREVGVDGHPVLLPHARDRFVHLLALTQLEEGNFPSTTPPLRPMLEMALLAQKHGGGFEWDELTRRFQAAGHLLLFQQSIELVTTLFEPGSVGAVPPSGEDALSAVRRELHKRVVLPERTRVGYLRLIRAAPEKLIGLFNLKRA